MAVWELIRDSVAKAHANGREWLTLGEVADEVIQDQPGTNRGSITADTKFHCINDPSKKHSPGLRWRVNPLLITDAPTTYGKRYRLLTPEERAAFLANRREDLELFSYALVVDWLANPTSAPLPETEIESADELVEAEAEEITGMAILELHLQDYIHRDWNKVFPDLKLYEGLQGREFRTTEPSIGILDFLAVDSDGNFVVIETKRDLPDRKAIGQILSYMGWVSQTLCKSGQSVRGVLITGEASDSLRLAAKPVPALSIYTYEMSFAIKPAD